MDNGGVRPQPAGTASALATRTPNAAAQRLTGSFIDALAPKNYQEAFNLCEVLARSEAVPKHYRGKPHEIMIAGMHGASLGLTLAQSVQAIMVVNGRPSVWGDYALGLVTSHPEFEDIEEFFEGDVDSWKDVKAVCIIKRRGRTPVRREFSLRDAQKALLLDKEGPWQTFTKRMMQMRPRGWAIRDLFPDALCGLYIVEEAMDIPEEPMAAVTITPTQTRTEEVRNKLEAVAAKIVGPETIEQPTTPTATAAPTNEAPSTESAPATTATVDQPPQATPTAAAPPPEPPPSGAIELPEEDPVRQYAEQLGMDRDGLRKYLVAKTGRGRLVKANYPVVLEALKADYTEMVRLRDAFSPRGSASPTPHEEAKAAQEAKVAASDTEAKIVIKETQVAVDPPDNDIAYGTSGGTLF